MPRFTVRWLMFVVAAISVVLGGYLWMTRPREVHLAPQPERANVDHEIFDVVLSDLIVNDDFGSDLDPGHAGKKTQILLLARTLESTEEMDETVSGLFELREKKLIGIDLIDDLNLRNPPKTRFSLAQYKPSNPNIHVSNLEKLDLVSAVEFRDAKGAIETFLPAYSQDGQTAVLYFDIGPMTRHGACAYYLLKKVNGRWTILERIFHYFA